MINQMISFILMFPKWLKMLLKSEIEHDQT